MTIPSLGYLSLRTCQQGQRRTQLWETGWPACPKNHADHILSLVRLCTGNIALREGSTSTGVTQTLCPEARGHPSAIKSKRDQLFHPVGTVGSQSPRNWAPLGRGAVEECCDGIFDGIWGSLEPPVGAGKPVIVVVLEEISRCACWCWTLLLAWI